MGKMMFRQALVSSVLLAGQLLGQSWGQSSADVPGTARFVVYTPWTFGEEGDQQTNPGPLDQSVNGAQGSGNGESEASNGADREERIVTDRPDFTEASSTVGKGKVQLEMGFTLFYDQSAATRSWVQSFPEFLLRIGVTDCVEFRCAWTYLIVQERDRAANASTRFDGGVDVDLGFKLDVSKQDRWWPEQAVVVSTWVPSGAERFNAGTVQPRINWLYGWDVSETFTIGGSTGVGAWRDVADGFIQGHQSLTSGYSITDQTGCYLEWFSLFFKGADDTRPEHYVDFGFTYQPKPTCQLDWRAGFGLNERAVDFFVGAGLSIVR